MEKRTVMLLQRVLADKGHYDGRIDGIRGEATDAGISAMIEMRMADLSGPPTDWSMKRKAIACLQLGCRDAGRAVGPIDGLWGPQTDNAVTEFEEMLTSGGEPTAWRDQAPSDANPHGWPAQASDALTEFYGPSCNEGNLVTVECPWSLSLDWDLTKKTRKIRCHSRVADSLRSVLERIHEVYGESELRRLGLHRYGGSYNCRTMRGGTKPSMHSWGIAIDWFPSQNKLRWGRDRASLAAADCIPWWQIWEEEGWVSLGRSRNFDWMHVQAARLE